MRKLILFIFVVALPALAVGVSNYYVFPDAFLLATILLAVTVGVAGIFTWQSGSATLRIARYCIVADVIICVILCVNLGSHWILAREVSGANQGTVERHAEEDREDRRKAAETERELAHKKADAEFEIARKKADAELAKANAIAANAERRRLAQLPVERRRSLLATPQPELRPTAAPEAAVPSLSAPAPSPTAEPAKQKLTAEQVRERWWWFLTALAFAECFASVLSGAVLAGVWEWDRNRDGVADHLQPVKAGYLGERTYRILQDGSREIIQSTYGDVGQILPPKRPEPPSRPIRRPLVRPSNPSKTGETKGNGADPNHIGSAGVSD